MNTQKMTINVSYTLDSDLKLFEMALVSMHSLFENNQTNNINLYIIYDNLFNKENLKYIKDLKKYSNCLNIKFLETQCYKYDIIKSSINFVEPLYIFELIERINCEKILYISSVTLVNDDLSEIYNLNMDNYSTLATEYIHPEELIDFNRQCVMNFSVMLINVEMWKNEKFYKKIFKNDIITELKTYPLSSTIRFFNLIIKDYKIMSFKYNYLEDWKMPSCTLSCSEEVKLEYRNLQTHLLKPTILTFFGPTPIDAKKCKNSYTNSWWKYAERTPIYGEIKQLRELNRYKLSTTAAQNSFNYQWLLTRIFPYIKPYWFRIILGFSIAIPLGLLDGVTAFALKPYMDYVVGGKSFACNWHGLNLSISSLQMAFIIPAGVILFAIVQGILRYLNGYLSTWTSQHITNDVKFDLFERLIHMHPQFFDDNSSGIVISRYMNDPKTASAGIVDQIKTITTSLFGALGLIAVMIYSSWKLAFVGVVVLCIAFIPVALIRKRIKDASNKNMVIGGKITTNINETYSGNKVMAAYGLQDRQNEYFKEKTWESFNINMSLYKRAGWMSPMMYLIASIGIAIVLGYGTYLINTGHMTAGSFASFVTSLLLLYKPVKTLGNTLTGIQNIFVAMGRVFELFDLEPKIKDSKNAVELKGFDKEIKFENVCFEYIPNQPVLKNINLTIPKNETLAIVGNSGGGKSTLVNLLPRFYDIKSGAITIDGKDIKGFTIKSLRQNISMVFQDNFLYTGTIKDNIMMGNPDATAEELMSAIKSAHLEDMIQELPEGLETELGERGLTLSGGQRQRVAIARAMLRNAPIVILDEATSALDNESEAIVQKAMDNLMQNKTVFVIAHRLSTIKNANRIAVINEGELVELGTHEELMSIENGEYKHLYEMQFRTQEEK